MITQQYNQNRQVLKHLKTLRIKHKIVFMTTSNLISLHQCFIVCHTVAEHDQINNGIDYLKHKNYVYHIIFTISLHDLCIYLVSKNMAQKQVNFIFQLSKIIEIFGAFILSEIIPN